MYKDVSKVIVVHQRFLNDDGSSDNMVITGIPISASNISRWVFTYRERDEQPPTLKVDIDMNKSLTLSGSNALDVHDFILSTFEERLDIYK